MRDEYVIAVVDGIEHHLYGLTMFSSLPLRRPRQQTYAG